MSCSECRYYNRTMDEYPCSKCKEYDRFVHKDIGSVTSDDIMMLLDEIKALRELVERFMEDV